MDATLTGKFLIAMPGIGDPRFDHTVIYMCSHNAEHAMGIVINKPKSSLTLGDVLDHLGISAAKPLAPKTVLDGGPVRPDRGFVLHSDDYAPEEGAQDVAPGIRLTATRDVLEALAGSTPPQRYVLALGCAGWSAGQLESELKRNSWLVVDAEEAILFDENHADKWARAIRKLGFEPAQIMGETGRA